MIRASEKILILFLPVMLLISSLGSISCSAEDIDTYIPDDAVQFDSHYYKIYNDASPANAESSCKKRGGHLAVITSEEEDKFLHDLCVNRGYADAFFGLSYNGSRWSWVNGEKTSYTNWADEKQSRKKDSWGCYSAALSDGTWSSAKAGTVTVAYICEWDSGSLISDATSQQAEDLIKAKKSTRHGDSYYKVFDIPLERGDAAMLCNRMGGHLVCIADKDEQKFVNDLIDKNGSSNMYWIGASLEDGGWCWQDGESLGHYNCWTAKKPNNSAEDAHFAVINKTLGKYDKGRWVAEPSNGMSSSEEEYYINFGFVCEWEIVCESDKGEFVSHSEGDWEILSESSCTSVGRRVRYCKRCGGIAQDEELPRTEHQLAERHFLLPGYTETVCTKCSLHTRQIDKRKIWILPFLVVLYFITAAAYLKARSDFERYARSKGMDIKTRRIPAWAFAIPPAAFAVVWVIVWLMAR